MNSGIAGGGGGGGKGAECPPETTDLEISADLPGKKRQGKKGKGVKIEKKRRKIVKEKVENLKKLKTEGEKLQNRERTFLFFFFFCFSLFKTTKICFGVHQYGNFLPEKNISCQEKKSGKMTLPPQKNFPVMPLSMNMVNPFVPILPNSVINLHPLIMTHQFENHCLCCL